MPALYLAQMNPEGRALYLKLPHPRHLFFLQLIPPISTSLWSVSLEHTLLRLPDLRAASDSQPERPHRLPREQQPMTLPGSDQRLFRHKHTHLPPDSVPESPVSDRGTPATRTDTPARASDLRRMLAEPSGSRSRRHLCGCRTPSVHGEACPADGTHSSATCATQRTRWPGGAASRRAASWSRILGTKVVAQFGRWAGGAWWAG